MLEFEDGQPDGDESAQPLDIEYGDLEVLVGDGGCQCGSINIYVEE